MWSERHECHLEGIGACDHDTHTHIYTRTHTHTHTYTHAHIHTHAHTHTHMHTHTHVHTHAHTRTHTHTHAHTHMHTHTYIHTHTHTCSQNKLLLLKESMDQGTQLDKDQKEAVMKLNEVLIQLELAKELQKQFATLSLEVKI